MKKFFIVALMSLAVAANAETMKFEVGRAGDGVTYGTDNLSIAITDQNDKFTCDANNCYFNPAAPVKFETRLMTGTKSGEKNHIVLFAKESGTLKIYARTASNTATNRTIRLTQNDQEILSHTLLDSEKTTAMAIEGEPAPKDVYPVLTVQVEAGVINLSYPVNAVCLYGFELESNNHTALESTEQDTTSVKYGKYCSYGNMIIIRDGLKFNADGKLIL